MSEFSAKDIEMRSRIAKEFDLSEKEKLFADKYRALRNGTEAAFEVYTTHNRRTCRQKAYDLLKKESVRAYIDTLDKFDAQKDHRDAADVIAELTAIAFFNPRDVLHKEWEPKAMVDVPDHAMVAVKSVKHTKHGVDIQFHNKLDALEKLGRVFKLWSESFTLNTGPKSITIEFSDDKSPFAEDEEADQHE